MRPRSLATRLQRGRLLSKRVVPDAKDWNEDLLAGAEASAIKAKAAQAPLIAAADRAAELEVRRDGSRLEFTIGGVSYRLWGARESFTTNLRISLRAEYKGECFYDNLDLYSARSRTFYSQDLAALFSLEPQGSRRTCFHPGVPGGRA